MPEEISAVSPVYKINQGLDISESNNDVPGALSFLDDIATRGGFFAPRMADASALSQLQGDDLSIVPIRLAEISKNAAQVDHNLAVFMTISTKLVDFVKKLIFTA